MSTELESLAASPDYRNLLAQISDTYTQGRTRAVQAVNTHMTETYWQVGATHRRIRAGRKKTRRNMARR
jgi:hypothetical protein